METIEQNKTETLEFFNIPELKISITKVIYKGKSYNEMMALKPKDCRLLTVEEGFYLITSWFTNDEFLIEQPINKNKENRKHQRKLKGGS